MHSGYETKLNYDKDVLYDFPKNEWVDWGKILTNFSKQFLEITQIKGDSTAISSPKCLIINDTLLCKTGKTIKHIGKVFDHCSRTYQLGMKALVYGFCGTEKVLFQTLFLVIGLSTPLKLYPILFAASSAS